MVQPKAREESNCRMFILESAGISPSSFVMQDAGKLETDPEPDRSGTLWNNPARGNRLDKYSTAGIANFRMA